MQGARKGLLCRVERDADSQRGGAARQPSGKRARNGKVAREADRLSGKQRCRNLLGERPLTEMERTLRRPHIHGENPGEVGGGGDDRRSAGRIGDPGRQCVRSPGVPRQQRHGVFSPFVDRDDRRVGQFVPDEGRDRTHRDAARADKHDAAGVGKRPFRPVAQAPSGVPRAPENRDLGRGAPRVRESFRQPVRQLRAPSGKRRDRELHCSASRKPWEKAGS